ncbi:YpiF family protein [Bacillus sp. S/N-304-OC-R1]|uniref:YpiF family protein n=1 Tax=Bacillus sp. S/N-304-OC-R1 TaxID=2758034 RepID=UPI001C8DCDD0|nr:YpiF family protein [Bacillus sp. S/N-304-OC-R1]MBY0122599.1 YpiF family protein [Bacillus sp. S/N-304-OC-R1]
MKWIPQDIDMFLQSKEYVDTAVLPLLPVSLSGEMKQTASMCDFISLLSVQLERQFRGRILMLPGYSYLKSSAMDKLQEDVKIWETELLCNEFKHVFYVTSDSSWKAVESCLKGKLIWLPSLPLENMDERNRNIILEDQVKQLMNLFMQSWQTVE